MEALTLRSSWCRDLPFKSMLSRVIKKVVGGAGKAIERGFCPNCGSQVTVKLERLPDILGLQAGSLEDPSIYRPAMDVFTASAQPWDHMDPSVQKHTHAPPI